MSRADPWNSYGMAAYPRVMADRPSFDRFDLAAVLSALGLLFVGYVVYPNRVLQYGVWLAIFTIWMAWFVFFGTKWMYRIDW